MNSTAAYHIKLMRFWKNCQLGFAVLWTILVVASFATDVYTQLLPIHLILNSLVLALAWGTWGYMHGVHSEIEKECK